MKVVLREKRTKNSNTGAKPVRVDGSSRLYVFQVLQVFPLSKRDGRNLKIDSFLKNLNFAIFQFFMARHVVIMVDMSLLTINRHSPDSNEWAKAI